jgi:hypothetical protein
VRGTDAAALAAVTDALVVRVCAGLPAAVGSLDDEAAAALRSRLDAVHAAIGLYAQDPAGEPARQRWTALLTSLADRRDLHGLLAGRIVRILADAQLISRAEAARRLARQLSAGVPAPAKGAWAEGFLAGGGLLLIHDRDLLRVLDDWVTTLAGRDFQDVLPLLRRAFGEFPAAERAGIGRAVRDLSAPAPAAPASDDIDERRAAAALRTVAAILGGPR